LATVGQAVSSSLDLHEVLTTIVGRATRLAEADAGTIFEIDDARNEFVHRASYGMPDDLVTALDQTRLRADSQLAVARAVRSGAPVQVRDIQENATSRSMPNFGLLRREGFRAYLAVPLLREQRVLGMLVIRRRTAGEFPQAILDLLQTFASQSVLAIENARLFEQVQETSRELETASQHKSTFLANMSHELR